MNAALSTAHELAENWERKSYVDARITPSPSQQHYLVLDDLRKYLERFRTDESIRILDYGAGPSPYRSLFPQAQYHRADYVASPGLDFLVTEEGKVPVPDESYDLVLSTQVAEHVVNPAAYFCEAFRVLRRGGTFIITTHGVWVDHGTPFDFQRWTGAGLARDLGEAGFGEIQISKITCGYRAHCFLFLDMLAGVGGGRTWLRNRLASLLQRTTRFFRPALHRRIDRSWPHLRIVDLKSEYLSGPPFYLLLGAEVNRPH